MTNILTICPPDVDPAEHRGAIDSLITRIHDDYRERGHAALEPDEIAALIQDRNLPATLGFHHDGDDDHSDIDWNERLLDDLVWGLKDRVERDLEEEPYRFEATATLEDERIVLAGHDDYTAFLDALRQWVNEQGDAWFDMPDKPSFDLNRSDFAAMGIEITDREDAQ